MDHGSIGTNNPFQKEITRKGQSLGIILPYTQIMDFYFPVGLPPSQPGPLARFMPSLQEANVAKSLQMVCRPGDRILDPFGSSPRVALEAASRGHGILVAVNNPVTRFLLRHSIEPLSAELLKSSLASFAASPKNGGRLEHFLLDLYRTVCSRCGEVVSADYFVWEKETAELILKGYHCDQCHQTLEESVSPEDLALAQSFTSSRLHASMALERVASIEDPDREHAEAALLVYPPRSLYALVTLLTKLEQLHFEPSQLIAAQALLLTAFDEANALWGYPEGRARPLSLAISARYRENNVWRALEKGVDLWAIDSPNIRLRDWEVEMLPASGEVMVFAGAARDLVPHLPQGSVQLLASVLPRPNQAYWSLSALWAAWLWGPESASPIKAVLRRRRYDWTWHAAALKSSFEKIKQSLPGEERLIALLPDYEPGFLAATLSSLDEVDFLFSDQAFRLGERQAVLLHRNSKSPELSQESTDVRQIMRMAILGDLRKRGEPASFSFVHASAWSALAAHRALAANWGEAGAPPISKIGSMLQTVLEEEADFIRYRKGTEIESGLFWLKDPRDSEIPLSDRVEELILEILRKEKDVDFFDIDQEVCRRFRGIHTPNRRIVLACLRSYAIQDPESQLWKLRKEDRAEVRETDHREIEVLLLEIGQRLGFAVEDELIRWDGFGSAYRFNVLETAALFFEVPELLHPYSHAGRSSDRDVWASDFQPELDSVVCVIPGGRSALFAEKVKRDPRLSSWIASGGRVIKYRHVRRLADETTLNLENFPARLGLDPPERQDPQMPLL